MTATDQIADLAVRQQALDPQRSFLVQAPAGSGKTELLIQRVLRLLATVSQPEEILAITFTRKAAAEMRERILSALSRARRGERPEEAHLQKAFDLAVAVNARDRELQWGLVDQPGRLRIGTIDSVNSWLNNRAPLSAGVQALNRVTEKPATLYREAARWTLGLAAGDEDRGRAVREYLRHCDNRTEVAIRLLEEMLGRRDQWLRHTGAGHVNEAARGAVEAAIGELLDITLRQAAAQLPPALHAELAELLAFAGMNIAARDGHPDLAAWRDVSEFPQPVSSAVALWRGLAAGLLTRSGEWRKAKGLTVRAGFPKEEPEYKARMAAMLAELEGRDELRGLLAAVSRLPDPWYTDEQWHNLTAILRVLPLAAASLQQVFAARGETDFTEVATHALTSLANGDEVGELTLVLDYTLRHILVDEFQDTSRSQYELLRRLTAGWEPGDGRTLFLVGDPMQSIYRFREAEVGIFLESRVAGINQLPLEFLRLETNFRSAPAIVDWVNRSFAAILPADENPATGAVPLAPSRAYRSDIAAAGVQWHVRTDADPLVEAQSIVQLVRDCVTRWPADTVGILVRSRAHAAHLVPGLRAAGIPYSAPDLEWLGQEPLAQDLLALTRALVHAADRIAWLAVLRAPWCGLSLVDLHALAAAEPEGTIWLLLQDAAVVARLSAAGRQRVQRLHERLAPWLGRRGACPVRELVEGAWQCLGGPACLQHADDLAIAEEYFAYLDEIDVGGDCAEVAELLDGIAERPVKRASTEDARVQIMTMHKAKGLEFDTVVLPALDARTRVNEKPLLLWQELAGARGDFRLVLAPLQARGAEHEPLYDFLWRLERQREAYEQQRLLYVASTRARARLHLFARRPAGDDPDTVQPAHGSLLRALWPAVASDVMAVAAQAGAAEAQTGGPRWFQPTLTRLPAAWEPPLDGNLPDWGAGAIPDLSASPGPGHWARHAGTVAHRWLQEIASAGAEAFDCQRVEGLQDVFRRQLRRLGVPDSDLPRACQRVRDALVRALQDDTGRWLLSTDREAAQSEWAIAQFDATGRLREHRIDRSFVDADGWRWIIDFKITKPAPGESVEDFVLAQQELYRDQLRAYGDAIEGLAGGTGRIRLALYFPLLPRLASFVPEPASE